jgi:anti-sigma factor RsiW
VSPTDPSDGDLPCRDFVGLVTAYIDGAVPDDERARVDEHLDGCQGCSTVLAQWRTVIALAGRLTDADVRTTDERTLDRLRFALSRRSRLA